MLRRLRIGRRIPAYAFSGEPLSIDYTLDNDRRWTAALALILGDEMTPEDRAVSGPSGLAPVAFFPRSPAGPGPASGGRGSPRGGAGTGSGRWSSRPDPRSGSWSGGWPSASPTRSPSIPRSASSPGGGNTSTGRRARRAGGRGTTARPSSRNTTGSATTGRATAPGGSTGGPRPGSASRWSRSSSSSTSRTWRSSSTRGSPEQGHAGAARGDGGRDQVRRHALPGDLPPPRSTAPPGLDRADPGGPAGPGLGQAAPRAPRPARHGPRVLGGGPLVAPRRRPPLDPPRVVPGRRHDQDAEPPGGGRTLGTALGRVPPRDAWAGDDARRIEGGPRHDLIQFGDQKSSKSTRSRLSMSGAEDGRGPGGPGESPPEGAGTGRPVGGRGGRP